MGSITPMIHLIFLKRSQTIPFILITRIKVFGIGVRWANPTGNDSCQASGWPQDHLVLMQSTVPSRAYKKTYKGVFSTEPGEVCVFSVTQLGVSDSKWFSWWINNVHLRSISKFMIRLGNFRNENNRLRAASTAHCWCGINSYLLSLFNSLYKPRKGQWPAGSAGFEHRKFNFRLKRTSFSSQMAAALLQGAL